MNNFLFGDAHSAYYETICGGTGAGPTFDGASCVQSHMTNTRITDPEILEARYPVLLVEFSRRLGSGGRGAHQGGDGCARVIMFLSDALTVTVLSERRVLEPRGIEGGLNGMRGKNLLIQASSSSSEETKTTRAHWTSAVMNRHIWSTCGGVLLPRESTGSRIVHIGGKNTFHVRSGDIVCVLTPGGGGYGVPGAPH